MENVWASPAAGQAPIGVKDAVCRALEEKGRVQVSLGRMFLFEELLQGLASDASVSVVALPRSAEAPPWHERLRRLGLHSQIVSERAPPPRVQGGVLWVNADWLSSPDHQAWCARHVHRIIARVPSKRLLPPASVPMAQLWCPGDGAACLADVALGFSEPRKFAVCALSGGAAREKYLSLLPNQCLVAYRGGRLSRGPSGWSGLSEPRAAPLLLCAETPVSLEELALVLDTSRANEVTILFGPDDILALQREALDEALGDGGHTRLFDWLSGDGCRSRVFANAFGESMEDCGVCDVCTLRSSAGHRIERDARAHVAKDGVNEKVPPALLAAADAPLFETLRDWRWKMARSREVPAYHIFSNAVLAGLARARPRDEESFLSVKGCGARKWEEFGLEVIAIVEAAV